MGENANGGGNGTNGGGTKRKKALAVFLVAAIVTGGAGAFYWRYRLTHISTDDAFVEGKIHPVSSRVAGTVVEVLVRDNQPVRKGEPLLRIDREPYAVREAQAASAREAASADLAAARSDVTAARSDITSAGEDLAAAKARTDELAAAVAAAKARAVLSAARLAQAERDAERARNLFERHSISRERNEKAQTELDVARAQADADREQVRLAEAALPMQRAEIARREAVLRQREAVLAQREARIAQQAAALAGRTSGLAEARLNTGYTEVDAPADGYVTRKSVETGQVVAPGQPLLAVAALDNVWIVANYKETDIEKIKAGLPVDIRVDTYRGKTFRGRVDSIMAGTGSAFSLFPPENATGNYVKVVQRVPVKILLERGEDPSHVMRIGMSVVPTVLVGH